jgi:hypothetical protein
MSSNSLLVYIFDGRLLSLPVARHPRPGRKPYAKPHWLPVTYSYKEPGGAA